MFDVSKLQDNSNYIRNIIMQLLFLNIIFVNQITTFATHSLLQISHSESKCHSSCFDCASCWNFQ